MEVEVGGGVALKEAEVEAGTGRAQYFTAPLVFSL